MNHVCSNETNGYVWPCKVYSMRINAIWFEYPSHTKSSQLMGCATIPSRFRLPNHKISNVHQ